MGQEVSLVDCQHGDPAALAVLGGEQAGGLGGEGGGAVGGSAAERGDHLVVDAAGAGGRIGQVYERVPGLVQGGDGGAGGAVLPAPTSPVMTPTARSRAHQVIRATASAWPG